MVTAIDRLARNARETLCVVCDLTEIGVRLDTGGAVYVPDSPMPWLFITILVATEAGAAGSAPA